ncbi:conserved hypothetical protein [Anaeromyxobacter sp. Fw109-5]|nr:conserved hypothetical protein [Anaeromyxobacter sp. Fw109-5]
MPVTAGNFRGIPIAWSPGEGPRRTASAVHRAHPEENVMLRRTLVAVLVATSLVPAFARGQDYEGEWADEGPPDYDVDVDVGVSADVTFDTFYGPLAAHGEWVSAGAYGRVWRPHVASGWRPYYYGHWEWTSEGWFWVSDEPWGWAAYHYGRWAYDGFHGWVWIPGYQWAPAWVSWRWSGDVVGWAPLAPGLSVYVTAYPFYDAWWTFVPSVSFVSVPVYSVAYAPRYTRHYFHNTAPAPARPAPRPGPGGVRPAPAPAWGGPAPRAIEARIGRPLRPARVVSAPSPAAGRARAGEIAVYRPGARGRGTAVGPSERAEGRGRAAGPAPEPRDGRGSAFAPAPGRREERGNAFGAPAPRSGGQAAGPRGWSRPERAAPAPSQRGDRTSAPRDDDGGTPSPRGWTRPQRTERERTEGAAPPSYQRESRGGSGGGRMTAPSAPRGGGRGGGGGAPAPRSSHSQGEGRRPVPAPHHR